MMTLGGFLSGETLHLCLALAAFMAIFLIAELWRYLLNPPTEWTRKFVHLSCGIIIACFHWIFASIWSVLALFAIFGMLMGVARYLKLFPSIYGIKRSSLGDIYYLISALVLFLISADKPVIYFIAMLTLTISDALAAVLGSTYQRMVYSVETHYKSLEGSVVFFLSTFLIVHIPLLLLLKTDPLHSIMIALQIALVVTCLEAICLNGFDNILIPIGTYFLLIKLLPVSAESIAWQIGWQLAIIAFLYYISLRFNFISISGAIVCQLFLFGAFVFGGPNWLIMPLIAFGIFVAILAAMTYKKGAFLGEQKIYQVIAAFHVTIVPAILFFAHNFSEKYIRPQFWEENNDFFYSLFIGAIVAHLVIALFRLAWLHLDKKYVGYPLILALAVAWVVLLIPFGLWVQMGSIKGVDLAICALIIGISSTIFYAAFKRYPVFQTFPWEFRIQSLSVLIGVALAWPLQLL